MDTMVKKMLIDATHAEETRVVVVDGNKVDADINNWNNTVWGDIDSINGIT